MSSMIEKVVSSFNTQDKTKSKPPQKNTDKKAKDRSKNHTAEYMIGATVIAATIALAIRNKKAYGKMKIENLGPKSKPKPKAEVKPEPKVEVTPEPKVEVTPEPKPEVTPEPKVEVTPEPKVEVTPEPKVEVTPEPKPEVTPEPKVEVTPEPKVEVTPEPKPEVTPEPKVEVTPEPKPEVTPEPKVEVTPEAKVEVTPEAKVEVTPEPKVEVTPEPKVEVTPEPKVEVTPEPKVEVTPEPKVEVTPEPKPEVKPEPKAEVKPEVAQSSRLTPEIEQETFNRLEKLIDDTDISKKIFTKRSTRQQKSDNIVLQIESAFKENKISISKADKLLNKIQEEIRHNDLDGEYVRNVRTNIQKLSHKRYVKALRERGIYVQDSDAERNFKAVSPNHKTNVENLTTDDISIDMAGGSSGYCSIVKGKKMLIGASYGTQFQVPERTTIKISDGDKYGVEGLDLSYNPIDNVTRIFIKQQGRGGTGYYIGMRGCVSIEDAKKWIEALGAKTEIPHTAHMISEAQQFGNTLRDSLINYFSKR